MPRVSLVTRHTHGCINPISPKSRWSDDCFNNVQWISQNALNAKLDRFTYCNNLYFSLRRWTLAIGNLRWSMEFPSMVGAWLRSRSHWLQASSLLTARQSRLCLGSLLRLPPVSWTSNLSTCCLDLCDPWTGLWLRLGYCISCFLQGFNWIRLFFLFSDSPISLTLLALSTFLVCSIEEL